MEESLLPPRADRKPDVYEKINALLRANPYGLTYKQIIEGVEGEEESIVRNAVRDMDRASLIFLIARDALDPVYRLRFRRVWKKFDWKE